MDERVPEGLGLPGRLSVGKVRYVQGEQLICRVVILVGILHVHLLLIRFGYVLEIVAV